MIYVYWHHGATQRRAAHIAAARHARKTGEPATVKPDWNRLPGPTCCWPGPGNLFAGLAEGACWSNTLRAWVRPEYSHETASTSADETAQI